MALMFLNASASSPERRSFLLRARAYAEAGLRDFQSFQGRAAEMEEVADTLRELGIDPHMASATVQRQRQMGALGKSEAVQAALEQGGDATLQAVSAALKSERPH